MTTRADFSMLMAQARKMKSVLVAKQVKLDQITSQHQWELPYCKEPRNRPEQRGTSSESKAESYAGAKAKMKTFENATCG